MKNLLTILIAVILCGAVSRAADTTTPSSTRADVRLLSGQKLLTQGLFNRQTLPVFVQVSWPNPYYITNTYDGVYFVNTNNTVGLPNPTNNVSRLIQLIPMGTNTCYISNGLGGGLTLALSNVVGTVVLCPSNKITRAWSTGTNWIVTHN